MNVHANLLILAQYYSYKFLSPLDIIWHCSRFECFLGHCKHNHKWKMYVRSNVNRSKFEHGTQVQTKCVDTATAACTEDNGRRAKYLRSHEIRTRYISIYLKIALFSQTKQIQRPLNNAAVDNNISVWHYKSLSRHWCN